MSNESKLIEAASDGYIGLVNALLKKPGINVNALDDMGWSALVCASVNNHPEVVKALLAVPGIDFNDTSSGISAFIWAAWTGHTKIVKILLDFKPQDGQPGIDINSRDNNGTSALMGAVRIRTFPSHVLAMLAVPGIDVNAKNNDGNSALMLAAESARSENVKALLAFPGIDVNATNNDGDTALDIATRNGTEEIVELIRKYQAGKKIGNIIEKKLVPDLLWRPPNLDIPGDPGGRKYQELVIKNLDNPIYKEFNKGGTRSKKYKRTKKQKKQKTRTKKSRKYRRTRTKERK
jgi:ankyrin repeat protein